MLKIKPFKALIYNQEKVKDLARVVCPPYDVISAKQQEAYHESHQHNFLRILLAKDIPGENKYEKASQVFSDWQKKEVFIQDEKPAIYFYSQQYILNGESLTRFGFMALLRLEDKECRVFGHEHTRKAAVEDRFKLLEQVKANLSPIFVIFVDKKRIINRLREKYAASPPFIDIINDEKIIHKVWRVNDPDILADIQDKLLAEDAFIADGHHRYEVACAYREEMRKKLGDGAVLEPFNYCLAYFTNVDPHGLTILPIHRLIKLSQPPSLPEIKTALAEYFNIEELEDKKKFFFLLQKAGQNEHALGMYKDKKYYLLRLKKPAILDKIISSKPPEYRKLDVSVLNYIILNKILGIGLEDKETLSYSPHADEFIGKTDECPECLAFFLNPVRVEQMILVAKAGQKMPPKSTYFYPKVLSGLVINKFQKE